MKLRTLSLVALAVATSFAAHADNLKVEPKRSVERANMGPAAFGTYHVLPDAEGSANVETIQSNDDKTRAATNDATNAALAAHERNLKPIKGGLVYNEITQDYGLLTGNISILAGSASVREVAQAFNLNVELVENSIGLGVLSAQAGVDLVELVEAIKNSGMVRAVEIDVQEHLNKPHY